MNLLWLQSAGCGGCTMSLLCAENPDAPQLLAGAGIEMLWHPSLSEATGAPVRRLLESIESGGLALDILCVEGSILMGPNGTGRFHMLSGTGRPMLDWVRALAPKAAYVLAVGSCAAFGGVTAAGENVADAQGLQYDGETPGAALGAEFRGGAGLPVINIGGCPTHPDWITETLLMIKAGAFSADDLDALNRPRFYTEHLAHHACPKNEFYEYKASAEKLSQIGCMMEHLGCVGTQAAGDCNIRGWNGGSSCTRAGYPCINCTAPEFEEPGHAFDKTPKTGGIPRGLPADMPKAWFMALASLSKAATPRRIAQNAVSDRIRTLPGGAGKPRK